MSQVQTLLRLTGTAHGVRTVTIAAKDEVVDAETGQVKYEAKPEASFDEAGIATRGRYGDLVTEGDTATCPVLLPEDAPRPAGGEPVDWWVLPYVRWTPGARGGRPYPQVAYRFAGVVNDAAAAGAGAGDGESVTSLAAAGGRRR